ncbi:MAG: hypothetical protein LBQ19_06790 [Synergistaceae bacterium]|jgi:hypothetical protein|nr:hypothetical protein [Synergistaceae bacterium]
MKFFKILAGFVFAIIVFAAGVWLFAPWESGGLFVMDKLRIDAARKGVYVNYNGFETSGVIFPVYRIKSLDIDSPFSRTSLTEVRVKVLPLSSILSRGVSCYVEFEHGGSALLTKDKLSHNYGRMKVTASLSGLNLSGVQVGGDLRVSGGLTFDRSLRRVSESTILVGVPDNIDAMMNGPVASQYLGGFVEQVNPGEWRIKYNVYDQ